MKEKKTKTAETTRDAKVNIYTKYLVDVVVTCFNGREVLTNKEARVGASLQ